jgi:hypothetical protein
VIKNLFLMILLTASFYGGWQTRGGFEEFKTNPLQFTFNRLIGK